VEQEIIFKIMIVLALTWVLSPSNKHKQGL